MARDIYTNNEIIMDYEHYMVHDEQMYNAHRFYTVTAASTQEFFIQTGAKEVHAKIAVAASGQSLLKLYEGITYTAAPNSNTITVYNMHRDSANSCLSVFFASASWSTNTEKLIDSDLIPGTTAGGPTLVGGEARNHVEWVLKANEKYVLQITNQAVGTISASCNMQFYEKSL